LGAAVAAYAAVHAGRSGIAVVGAGVAGLALVAGGVASGSAAPLPAGVFLLGVEYAVSLLVRGGEIDALAPAAAGVLFATAELAYLAVEREARFFERDVLIRRLVTIALAALVTGGVGGVVVTASDVSLGGGVVLEAVGVASAVAAVGTAAALAWRRREPGPG
jgi:hypothetical protein